MGLDRFVFIGGSHDLSNIRFDGIRFGNIYLRDERSTELQYGRPSIVTIGISHGLVGLDPTFLGIFRGHDRNIYGRVLGGN